jgi:hypothetical protein
MKPSVLHSAIGAALLLSAAGAAQANFYSIAISEITNFTVTGISANDFSASSLRSTNNADWGANEEQNSITSVALNPIDPQVSDCGPGGCDIGLAQNQFAIVGNPASDDWARGDSQVSNPDIFGSGAASAVAETVAKPNTGTPPPAVEALGENAVSGTFELAATTLLSFSFDADAYIEVETFDLGATAGSDIAFVISITEEGSSDAIFEWVPTLNGGATGGTVSSSPFSLNTGRFASDIESFVFDPAQGNFAASTTLDAGSYSLRVTMTTKSEGSQPFPAPTPATLALLGAGLIGLGAARRRSTRA